MLCHHQYETDLRAYLEEYLATRALRREKFRQDVADALQELHRQYMAGVADMRKDVQFILKATSLLLAGCLFHDCGKLWENCYPKEDFTMPYSEAGELLGHIPLGIELVNNLWKRIMALPEADSWKTLDPPSPDVRMHLLHLIASHHGELAFGSPVFPKTPEAVALHSVSYTHLTLPTNSRV